MSYGGTLSRRLIVDLPLHTNALRQSQFYNVGPPADWVHTSTAILRTAVVMGLASQVAMEDDADQTRFLNAETLRTATPCQARAFVGEYLLTRQEM